jgi:citrate lyase subunit beta/citryl-CoA lyase
MAAMRMPVTQRNPAAGGDDRFDTTMMAIAVAARKHGLQAIDGPYPELRDLAGCRRSAERAAGFGYDGKWVLHPDQIEVVNTAFSPTQDEYDQAEITLAAYDYHVSAEGGHNGAAVLGGLMIDEASRRVAALTAERGRLLSMQRTKYFNP